MATARRGYWCIRVGCDFPCRRRTRDAEPFRGELVPSGDRFSPQRASSEMDELRDSQTARDEPPADVERPSAMADARERTGRAAPAGRPANRDTSSPGGAEHGNDANRAADHPEATPFADLLAAARRGCADAIGRLVQRHRGALWRLAYRQTPAALRVKVAPSDLVQETLVEAHDKLEQFRGESAGQFAAWLNQILISKLAAARRRYQQTDKRAISREVELAAVTSGEADDRLRAALAEAFRAREERTPGSHVANAELAAMMRAAMTQLPEDYQQVIVMRNWQGRSFADIGEAMGRSMDAVRKLWTRAVDRLAAELDGCHDRQSEK